MKESLFAVIAVLLVLAAAAYLVYAAVSLPEYIPPDTSEQAVSEVTDVSDKTQIRADGVTVYMLDVGQGDCLVALTPSGRCILVDCGTYASYGTIKGFLDGKGITSVDIAVFTHPHADHIGCADLIIENCRVDTVYMPDCASTTATFMRLLDALENSPETEVIAACAGVTAELDGAVISILSPFEGVEYDEMNEYSVVFKLSYGESSMLFTGDAERINENEMLASGTDLSADILKVGHHGSSSSSSAAFLRAVSPGYALISCGADNSYGHPHTAVLGRLADAGAAVYRTDINGTITAFLGADGVSVKPSR